MGAVRREGGPLPRAARPYRVHAVAPGLQRGHPQAASVDPRPRLPPVVSGPQLRPERPAIAEVQEPDLAHAARAAWAARGRRADGAPAGGAGVGAVGALQHDTGGPSRTVTVP